ncbi:MAG: TIGR03984 family CRISPR-associated protein [Leptospiraceae bacterium]|nr:TIGR03984 family CRISPR-associated protein [Leptospiraceae bacterium]
MEYTPTIKENGLSLYEKQEIFDLIISENITGENWKNYLINELFNIPTYFIAYLHYAVVIGRCDTGKLHYFDPSDSNIKDSIDFKFLQKMRIFNKDAELHIWKTQGNFKGRIRAEKNFSGANKTKHNDLEIVEFIEANQILFGTTSIDLNNGFTKLTEDRGTEVILPFTNIDIDNKDKRMAIRTRNYIGYNEIGQAGYVDCRFVEFVKRDKDHIYTWDEEKKV